MKKYIEFYDTVYETATEKLNGYITENEGVKVTIVGFQVVKTSPEEETETHILVEVEE